MIGRIAETIMNFIVAVLTSLVNFLKSTAEKIIDLLYQLFTWLGQLLERLFQALIDVLQVFFNVIYDLIRCLLYLIYMIGVLAVKLFLVLWELAKLLYSFVVGFGKTVASLFYTERSSGGHGYSEMMGKVVSNMDVLQLDVVAYILLFVIWVFGAIGVIKILSTMKNA